MNHRSLAFRLAVWYALLLSATFALVGHSDVLWARAVPAHRPARFAATALGPGASRSSRRPRPASPMEPSPRRSRPGWPRNSINRFVRVTRAPASRRVSRRQRRRDQQLRSRRDPAPDRARGRRRRWCVRMATADGRMCDQHDAGRHRIGQVPDRTRQRARAHRGAAAPPAEPAGTDVAGAGGVCCRRRLPAGAAGPATGRAHGADRGADQRAGSGGAAAGGADRRCAATPVDLAESHAQPPARLGFQLAPLSGRRLA